MGKIFFQPQKGDFLCQEELNDCKDILLNDFSLIDNLDFWKKFKKNNCDDVKFENYRIFENIFKGEGHF